MPRRRTIVRDGLFLAFSLLALANAVVNFRLTASTEVAAGVPPSILPVDQHNQQAPIETLQTTHQQRSLQEQSSLSISATPTTNATAEDKPARKKLRFLVGFFAYGVAGKGRTFKRRLMYRQYFDMMRDPRICPLSQLLYGNNNGKQPRRNPYSYPANHNVNDDCEFIYTFVSGFDNASLPTEIVRNSSTAVDVQVASEEAHFQRIATHPKDNDLTFLNIQENMNEGKSQTWFHYASQVMDRLDIQYAVKTDTDCLIVLDHFFDFVDRHLAPLQSHQRVYAGRFSDKAFWGGSRQFNTKDGVTTVNALRRRSAVSIYMAGELYIVSKDLAHWISSGGSLTNMPWYEGVEDHDVGMRVYDHPEPIIAVRLTFDQMFWVHPAKTRQVWQLFMNRESRRKNGEDLFFEGEGALGEHWARLMKIFDKKKDATSSNNLTSIARK